MNGRPAPVAAIVKELAANNCSGAFARDRLVFSHFTDLLPGSTRQGVPCIYGTDDRKPLTHDVLAEFVHHFPDLLASMGIKENTRIGVVLPNGPEAGLAVLCTMSSGICCPINAQNTTEEIVVEILALKAPVVIIPAGGGADDEAGGGMMQSLEDALTEAGVVVLELTPDPKTAALFTLSLSGKAHNKPQNDRALKATTTFSNKNKLNRMVTGMGRARNSWVLLLHTSGTSGKKKVVPYTLDNIAVGCACVAASWGLGYDDVCFNMMPLFHSGGIVRNLLGPILAGGATILCPGFDPSLFWDKVPPLGATWYYAAPTMHSMILGEMERRKVPQKHRIRLIGNAAGPLLPSLARQLKDAFGESTVVLPSYGMTECMPISAPPLDYNLADRVGSSGRSVGPELTIRDGKGEVVANGTIGNITVRGPPTFTGYEDPNATAEAMFPGNWFNTGDLGYMDSDGYLYITGRSKEVINRGGELISPVEIEDAVSAIPTVAAVIAISCPHDVLQEVVGIVITTDPNCVRPGLTEIQQSVSSVLHPAKWPQVVVYMDDGLPMTATNKVQRVNLAKRLGLPEINDSTPLFGRLFEADCPPKGTPVQDAVPCRPVDADRELGHGADALRSDHPLISDAAMINKWGTIQALLAWKEGQPLPQNQAVMHQQVLQILEGEISDYALPTRTILVEGEFKRNADGSLDEAWLESQKPADESELTEPRDNVEKRVQAIFADVLGVKPNEVALGADFFAIGGDSFRAGRVVGNLRRDYAVPLQVAALYQYKTVAGIAAMLQSQAMEKGLMMSLSGRLKGPDDGSNAMPLKPVRNPGNPKSIASLLVQASPLIVFLPMLRVSVWMFFVYIYSVLHTNVLPDSNNFFWGMFLLVFAGFITAITRQIVLPLLSIILKWLVIGRYREGIYPTFSSYYLRWWFVSQMLALSGRGMFGWHPYALAWYYRLMGAKIGKNVVLSTGANISEFDLVTIGDDCILDVCTVSPMALLSGAFQLRPIKLGDRTIMGSKSIAAPGAVVREDGFIPPCMSSHEILEDNAARTDEEKETLRSACKALLPGPNIFSLVFFCAPVILAVEVLANVPVLAALYGMVKTLNGYVDFAGSRSMQASLLWFALPERYYWYVIIKLSRDIGHSFLHLALSIALKRLVLGRFKAGPRTGTQWERIRYYLTDKLIVNGTFSDVSGMLGPNLPAVGWLMRLLGAKIGKRIFFPGSGIHILEYDMLEIQDDCVFGSRSVFYGSDTKEFTPITIKQGSMVSDRCVLYPGTVVGRNAVLGSGTKTPANFDAPGGSIWLGNDGAGPVVWQSGSKESEEADTLTPFGRAFCQRKAPYYVWPLWQHILQNTFIHACGTALWTMPIVLVLFFGVHMIQYDRLTATSSFVTGHSGLLVATAAICAAIAIPAYFVVICVVFIIDIGGKWLIIGRRKAGRYNWDESSYNQRWQLHKQLQSLRAGAGTRNHSVVSYIQGSQYLVWYFKLLGAKIGERVCLYPNGADPMMTEPDLVTIDDWAGIDSASLVAHINSRGIFDLNELVVGKGAIMRRNTRLLSGAAMEEYSTMLEHTLVVSGDVLGPGTTWQGWPAHQVSVSEARLMGALKDIRLSRMNTMSTFKHVRKSASIKIVVE